MAYDLYVSKTDATAAASAAAAAASADDDKATEAASAAGKHVIVHLKAAAKKTGTRPWEIPDRVEKGFEIPIGIDNLDVRPPLGEFKRLGLSIVVNCTWLAYYLAKEEKNEAASAALEKLMLD